uniref:Nuclease HARBI1 n=1 Tax=Sipha flava TaxID=143950 RepID=A0A2S2Q4X3_9HEMI
MSLQITAVAYVYIHLILEKNNRRQRRWWQTQLFTRRSKFGRNSLLNDLRTQEINGQFQNFMRMSSSYFDLLINLIGPKIVKTETILREPIWVKDRLAVTLRFLATDESFTSLQHLLKMSKQVISNIVKLDLT